MRLDRVACCSAALLSGLLAGRGPAGGASPPADGLEACNVVWTTPSENSWGSMPLGNGDVGCNLWVEADGGLVMLLSKTDAWDAHCRLLKLGRVRLRLSPNPFAKGRPFRQALNLRAGQVEIDAGPPGERISLRIWADAHHPVIRLEGRSDRPRDVEVALELWRTAEQELKGRERDSARGVLDGGYPLKVPPDKVIPAAGRIVWFHRNVESCWPITMKVQGLSALAAKYADPLIGRTFGGSIIGDGLVSAAPTMLKSPAPLKRLDVSIFALTRQPATPQEWLGAMDRMVAADAAADRAAMRAAHEKWWGEFWDRSWIYASGSAAGPELAGNALPLRIGASSTGGNRFRGRIAQAMVLSRAITGQEAADLAAGRHEKLARDSALAGWWTFDNLAAGAFPGRGNGDLPAKVVGEVDVADAPHGKAVRLTGRGFLEVAHGPRLDLRRAVTLAAWVCPEDGSAADGRILDKSQAGTSNGYLLDTWPGRSIRMITEPSTLVRRDCLAAGRWSHVAATFDSSGAQRLYLDGKVVAEAAIGGGLDKVTQGYALQRFINAAGGRGAMPVKFNGSIFTVDGPDYGPDYRRWGGCYWWQNTRLPYWSMIPCGDWDLMEPLWRMYMDMLPLREDITRLYYGHQGAFFAETMYFWGTPCNDDHGWRRGKSPDNLMLNPYIRRLWEGGLELTMMMLDRHEFTQDEAFARKVLVPFAESALAFYDQHYPRTPQGRLRIEPAQSLETWWTAVNPMPEVAGLHAVLERMLALPAGLTTPARREAWKKLQAALPPVPTRQVQAKAGSAGGGGTALAAADEFSDCHNCENPELYAVFPYRLCTVARPGLEAGILAFQHRINKGSSGWQQDAIQAAMLGLRDEAGRIVVRRFADTHAGSRFPAFWGPNFDWIPDQDHGSNNMMGLQAMLLQHDGRKIILLPAWPKTWDVSFKLHAPYRTTVECTYRGGKVERLTVAPADRAGDVVRMDAP